MRMASVLPRFPAKQSLFKRCVQIYQSQVKLYCRTPDDSQSVKELQKNAKEEKQISSEVRPEEVTSVQINHEEKQTSAVVSSEEVTSVQINHEEKQTSAVVSSEEVTSVQINHEEKQTSAVVSSEEVTSVQINHDEKQTSAEVSPVENVTSADAKSEGNQTLVEFSPEEKQLSAEEIKRNAAKKKLNDLLTSLATTQTIPDEPVESVQLSRPKPHRMKSKKSKEDTAVKPEKEVALEPELVQAAADVAESLGGDVEQTKQELFSSLKSHSSSVAVEEKQSMNLSELISGMQVEKNKTKPVVDAYPQRNYDAEYQQRTLRHKQQPTGQDRFQKPSRMAGLREHQRVDLFGGNRLKIFIEKREAEDEDSKPQVSTLPVWDVTHKHELQLAITQPPSNAFVEMIEWTKAGKLWQFPIDNEIGLQEEKSIGFHEHVFLERHLEGWCPTRGPIRHYMELVCTGLSKNPHLTVERKKAHIEWYKNYFAEKEELLRELGAIENTAQ